MTDDEVRSLVTARRYARGHDNFANRTHWDVTGPSHWHADPPIPRGLLAHTNRVLAAAIAEAAASAARLRRDAEILPLMQPEAPVHAATVRRPDRLRSGWRAA